MSVSLVEETGVPEGKQRPIYGKVIFKVRNMPCMLEEPIIGLKPTGMRDSKSKDLKVEG